MKGWVSRIALVMVLGLAPSAWARDFGVNPGSLYPNAACESGGGASPPQFSVQFNNPLGSFDGTSNFTTDTLGDVNTNGKVTVNNQTATPGTADIEVQLDPNNDSLITLDTGGTNVGWGLQAADSSSLGHGHFAQFELVSKLWEPLICWGDGAGTFYNGTCSWQQPINGDAPAIHLIRFTDTAPTGSLIDAETNVAGNKLWSIDALGAEHFFGSSSGNITLQPQAASGTYNWNWPTTAGSAGQALLSGGGAGAPMTWGNSAITGGTCSAGQIVTSISSSGVPTCTPKTDPIVCGSIPVLTNSQEICWIPITKSESLPTGCIGSQANSRVAATASTTITINQYRSGSIIASDTVAWSASGKTGTFTCSGGMAFVAGDAVEMIGPSTADATLAVMGVTLQMTAGAL